MMNRKIIVACLVIVFISFFSLVLWQQQQSQSPIPVANITPTPSRIGISDIDKEVQVIDSAANSVGTYDQSDWDF